MRENRSNNLDMIRWMNGGHEYTAGKLSQIANSNYVSKMATGDMEISDHVARGIEKIFQLPDQWLDRDNETLVKTCKEDYELLSVISGLPKDSKLALKSFLITLNINDGQKHV